MLWFLSSYSWCRRVHRGCSVFTALGFSPGGIVVGSWAAKWIAPYAGKWKSYDSVVKICTTLCTASDYFDSRDEDSE